MNKIKRIIKSNLCIGCGLCEAIATKQYCEMKLNQEGFYVPEFKKRLPKEIISKIIKCCPGIHIESKGNKNVWGNILHLSESWSCDKSIRYKSSSGGVVTSLAIYLLENKLVDGILHVGIQDDSYLYNSLKISRTKDDIIKNSSSRYAPALVFNQIIDILEQSDEIYAFIGKPCDIAGIKNILREYPNYSGRIKYNIAILCAGMPSYNGTTELLKLSGHNHQPTKLKYRGEGWPGCFEVTYHQKPKFTLSYNESWGNVLGKHLGFRCKICPDGIGLLADIAVGDSWNTKDGYPDFKEKEGRSFVIIRTINGQTIYNNAISQKKIINRKLSIENINTVQQYQYKRRILSGYRILPIYILSGFLLKFKGLGIYKLMFKAKFRDGVGNMYGTTVRFIKLLYKLH